MLLAFGDSHLGVKTYSTQDTDGFYTAEKDSINSLEEIYTRCKKGDITHIVGLGDICHTNNPTNSVIEYLVNWILRMDALGIPFEIIPGNHDDSFYHHSLNFIHSLPTKNVQLVDARLKLNQEEQFTYSKWNDWTIFFAPYSSSYNLKQKNEITYTKVETLLKQAPSKSIIVSHIEEASCKLGSESQIIAKGVDIIDIDNIHETKDIILLTGHIHLPQTYKKGHATICYPGSTICIDSLDSNQRKGYVLIDKEGTITREYFTTTRRFVRYDVPANTNVFDYFKTFRLPSNEVVFITTVDTGQRYDETQLSKMFASAGSMFGRLKYVKEDSTTAELTAVFNDNADPFKTYTSWLDTNIEKLLESSPLLDGLTTQDLLKVVKQKGIDYIEKAKAAKEQF